MSVINGTDLYMWMDGDLVAYSTSYTIVMEMETRPRTNKGTGVIRTVLPGMFRFSASCDGLYVFGSSVSNIVNAMMARNPVTLQFGQKDTVTGLVDEDEEHFSGDYLITKFELNATDAENATWTAAFEYYDNFGAATEDYWWVATDGSDATGTGEYSNPWLTLGYAVTQVTTPGETIHMKAGTYNVTSQIVKPLGVSIVGQGDSTHIISTFASNYTGSINCASPVATPVNDNSSISYIKLTGSGHTGRVGIYGAYRNGISIHHCTIEDFAYGAVRFISNNADAFTAPAVSYATSNSVYNCTITDCGYLNSSYSSLWFDGQHGFKIYNNVFDETGRTVGTSAWATIKCNFNTAYDIYNNTFYRNNHENGRFNFFIESWNYEGNCQFRDNVLYGLAGADFAGPLNQIKAGFTYGLKVTGNRFLNSTNANYTNDGNDRVIYGICIEGSGHDEVEISRNQLQRFGWGIEIATASSIGGVYEDDWTLDNITVAYNLITDCGYADSQYCYGITVINETNTGAYTTTMTNFAFLNNVITAMTGTTYQGIRLSCNGELTGLDIINNIIYNFDSYGVYLGEHSTDGFALTTADVTYNCMNSNGTNTVGIDGDITQTTVDVTTGNIVTAPSFVSSTDFRLQAGSGCINAGLNVGLATDYAGRTVADPPDIGAYEYV